MAPPPAKKRRLAVAASGVVTRRTTTRSQKPRLSAELLARVASYSSLGRDLLSLCVVAGPEDCALIRHTYLRNNFGYLSESLSSYVRTEERKKPWDRTWKTCRDRYRAWMAVNNDWRKHVTDENMEKLERAIVATGVEGKVRIKKNPFVPLCNPAVAIELGLQEVLVHLVEQKGIDVNNSYRWNNLCVVNCLTCHLLVACLACENIEAFQYLLGRKDIDIHSTCDATNDDWRILDAALYMGCCADFFRELLAHPSFDIVTSYFAKSPLHIAIDFLDEDDFLDHVHLPTWKAKFRLLLSAGADPYVVDDEGLDAIQYAKEWPREKPESQALKDAVEILEDWVAIK